MGDPNHQPRVLVRRSQVVTEFPAGQYLSVPPIICRPDAAKRFPPQTPGALSIVDGSCVRLPKLKRPMLRERLRRLVMTWAWLKRQASRLAE
jgi:hypothetical protein